MARDLSGASTDFIDWGHQAAFNFATGDDFTIFCWIKFDALPAAGSGQRFFIKHGTGSLTAYPFSLQVFNPSSGPDEFVLNRFDGSVSDTAKFTAIDPIELDTWYFIACGRDGAQADEMFITAAKLGDTLPAYVRADQNTTGDVTNTGELLTQWRNVELVDGKIGPVMICSVAHPLSVAQDAMVGKPATSRVLHARLYGADDPEPDVSGNGFSGTLTGTVPQAEGPIADSTTFFGVNWTCTREEAAVESDLWCNTWHDDDAIYTAWGDGWGFDLDPAVDTKKSYGFSKITGTPESWTGEDLFYGPDNIDNGKLATLLSLSGTIYGILWDQTLDPDNYSLIKSTDEFATAPTTVFTFTHDRPPWDQFFLQNGKSYAGNTDGFVYLGFRSADRHQTLYRVATGDIETKTAWEVYTGLPGDPSWSQAFVGTTPGLIQQEAGDPVIVFFPGTSKYVMATQTGPTVERWALYEADAPWGPYTRIVQYISDWCAFAGTDGVGIFGSKHIVPKWISGNDFTVLTSSDDGTLDWDSLNKIDGTLSTEELGTITPTGGGNFRSPTANLDTYDFAGEVTIASGDDRLVVAAGSDGGGKFLDQAILDPGGPNETTLNRRLQLKNTGATGDKPVAALWDTENMPPAGTYDLRITVLDPPSNLNGLVGKWQAGSGFAPGGPEATVGKEDGTTTDTPSTSITTLTDGAFVFDLLAMNDDNTTDWTPDAGQTETVDLVDSDASPEFHVLGSYREVGTAGAATMGWSGSTTADWAHALAAYAPAPLPEEDGEDDFFILQRQYVYY